MEMYPTDAIDQDRFVYVELVLGEAYGGRDDDEGAVSSKRQ